MEGASRSWPRKLAPLVLAALAGVGGAWALNLSFRGGRGTREAAVPVAGPAGVEASAEAGPAPAPAAAPAPLAVDPPIAAEAPRPATPPAPGPGEDPAAGAAETAATEETAPPPEEAGDFAGVLPPGEKLRFREVWAYLMPGEMGRWSDAAPITDLGLFDFTLDATGGLSGRADAAAIERAARRGIRTHLVVATSGNKTLLHLVLSPRYGVRKALIESIARLPRKFKADGVQLDFEGPRAEERADLLSFVRELRSAMPRESRLSLAIPAKTADSGGAYVYADLAEAADRLLIMVYDEHWKGGPPGAISDLSWHEQVLAFAKSTLPAEKVVVGLPFYGRVWQREEVARAVNYRQARDLAGKTGAPVRRDPRKTHSFTFRTEVTAECWFEDASTLRSKLESARALGFENVGFWRLGQEDPRIWEVIERE